MTALVPPRVPRNQALETLRAQVTEREAVLLARSAEVERTESAIESFTVRYRQDVGLLHEELERLEAAIVELELGEINRRLEEAGAAADAAPETSADEAAPRFTTDAVRKLFRDVARAIHPDLAEDESARTRRHSLMVAANRAYELGDEEQLRRILAAWERSPDAVPATDPDAARVRLMRRLAQIDEELEGLERDLAALQDTPMWKLKAMVDEAAAKGKDLVADMVRRLKRDIMVATNRLEAMRSVP
ncbi:MAG: hypothetical protein AB7O67_08300 [Vicinamibacterales bacterium]